MNYHDACRAGRNCGNASFTDDELENQLTVLECFIGYLERRGDCDFITGALRVELMGFEHMKRTREEKR